MAPRQRDYHAEYLRRLDLARERFPDAPRSEITAHARGHRSSSDLESALGRRDVTNVDVQPEQQPDGRYRHVDIVVEFKDGSSRTYRLRGHKATVKELRRLGRRLDRKNIKVAGLEYLRKRRKAA